ncbi:hypothetical protein T4E_10597 [Trichinella pseudospiralis]|uniref:Uncharacterized protein n=2 Tax=Trichinella pseudospiralis TaxID=6337 RepID=A0A0V0XLR0_TRIPS|nr:hypothetical protein T4E_10597 [Trichinella pseudospiralis]
MFSVIYDVEKFYFSFINLAVFTHLWMAFADKDLFHRVEEIEQRFDQIEVILRNIQLFKFSKMITERRKFAKTDKKNPLKLAVERPVVNFNLHVPANAHPSLLSRSRLNVNALIFRLLTRAMRRGGADPQAVISHFDGLSACSCCKPGSMIITTAAADRDCLDTFRRIYLASGAGGFQRLAFNTGHISTGKVVTASCEFSCFLDLSKLNAHVVNLPKKTILTIQYKQLDVVVDSIAKLLQKFYSADLGPELCCSLKNADAKQVMIACAFGDYGARQIANDNDDSDGIFGLLKWMVDVVAHQLDVHTRFAQVVEADFRQIVVANSAEFAFGEQFERSNQCPDADLPSAQPSEAPDSPVLFADHAASSENCPRRPLSILQPERSAAGPNGVQAHSSNNDHFQATLSERGELTFFTQLNKHASNPSQAQLHAVANSPVAVGDFAFFSDLLSLSPTQYSRSQLSTAEPESSIQLGYDQENCITPLRRDPYSPDSTQEQNFCDTFHHSQLISSQFLADSSTDIVEQGVELVSNEVAVEQQHVDKRPLKRKALGNAAVSHGENRQNFNNDHQHSTSPMKLPKCRNELEMDNTFVNHQSEIMDTTMNIEINKSPDISTKRCIYSSIGRTENAKHLQQINTPECYQRLSLTDTNKTSTSMNSSKFDVIPSYIVGEYRTAPISTRTRRSFRLGLSRRERVLSLHQRRHDHHKL